MGLKFKEALLNIDKNYRGLPPASDFDGYAVTGDDSNDLVNGPTEAIYVTGSGNVAVNLLGGGTATLTSLVAGQILRIAVTRIKSTSTTATGIYALYRGG